MLWILLREIRSAAYSWIALQLFDLSAYFWRRAWDGTDLATRERIMAEIAHLRAEERA